jgi:4-carboxymuconolactone decarboxylase
MNDENLTNKERHARGIEKLRELSGGSADGGAGGDMVSWLDQIAPDVSKYAMEFVLGDVLSRPGLDTQTREMLNIAVLTAIQAPIELKLHIHCALNCGVSRDEVIEIISQQIVYVGFPIAINGLHAAKEVFDQLDGKS